MAGIKGATAHNAKITFDGLLALLRSHPGKGFALPELAEHFDCSFSAAGMLARRLAITGLIHCTTLPGRGRVRLYHVGRLMSDKAAAPASPVARYVGEVVPPRTFNAWTPPMRDYGSKLAAHATLAMLARR